MIVIQVELEVKEDTAAQARSVLQDLAEASREENGCVTYAVNQSIEEPHRFFIWERWEDEASLKAHKETEHYNDAITIVAGFVENNNSWQCRQV